VTPGGVRGPLPRDAGDSTEVARPDGRRPGTVLFGSRRDINLTGRRVEAWGPEHSIGMTVPDAVVVRGDVPMRAVREPDGTILWGPVPWCTILPCTECGTMQPDYRFPNGGRRICPECRQAPCSNPVHTYRYDPPRLAEYGCRGGISNILNVDEPPDARGEGRKPDLTEMSD
jgi:hypothetical protein